MKFKTRFPQIGLILNKNDEDNLAYIFNKTNILGFFQSIKNYSKSTKSYTDKTLSLQANRNLRKATVSKTWRRRNKNYFCLTPSFSLFSKFF